MPFCSERWCYVAVSLRDFTLQIPLVGIERTVTATLSLEQPAPDGGATFSMSVGDTGVATVSPATLVIPAGQSQGSFQLTGGADVGFTEVTADGSADGYETDSVAITVTDRLIDLPTAQVLALSETRDLTILIAPNAAPAGGVAIEVTSSSPSLVQVLTPTVVIPEGAFSAKATVQAADAATGSATITAGNPGFAPDATPVSVTAELDILQSFANFEQEETDAIHIQLRSGGAPFPAPPGGVEVTLTSDDPLSAFCVRTLLTKSPLRRTVISGRFVQAKYSAALPGAGSAPSP